MFCFAVLSSAVKFQTLLVVRKLIVLRGIGDYRFSDIVID